MDIQKTFEMFFRDIKLESHDVFEASLKGIAKKLNSVYYDLDSDVDHLYIVGSVGRKTAIRALSDIDIIFDLPSEVYDRFNAYQSNGQSLLLQEIKGHMQERYPRTSDIIGDGQVVVIPFTDYTVELLPAFIQSDSAFLHPDTHDGGSWKPTNPIPEQEASIAANTIHLGHYVQLCNLLRCWKNTVGFPFCGLLIDTLVYECLSANSHIALQGNEDYIDISKQIFEFLRGENPEQACWYALGSGYEICNNDQGAFVKKAKSAYSSINTAKSEEEIENVFTKLLGKYFKDSIVESTTICETQNLAIQFGAQDYEEFIEDLFPVDVRYNLRIDCKVTQDGFQPDFLSNFIKLKKWLSPYKQLKFYITNTNVPTPYRVFWKVKNTGAEAYKRNMLRGEIHEDGGSKTKHEHTDFRGIHYVECYIIKNNVCVARDHLIVPISTQD